MSQLRLSTRGPTRERLLAVGVVGVVLSLLSPLWASPAGAYPVLDVTVEPSSVPVGETFTISVSGTSDGDHSGVHIGVYSGDSDPALDLNEFTSLVGCTGNTDPCVDDFFNIGYSIPLGDLTNGQAFAATITLRIDPDAPLPNFVVRHQFLGADFGAATTDGPTVTITRSNGADVGLSMLMNGTRPALVEPAIDYWLEVFNHGPDPVSSATVEVSFSQPVSRLTNASGCALSGGKVICEIGPISPGGFEVRRFRTYQPVLTLGLPFVATARRTASVPVDANPANDTAVDACLVAPLFVGC